MAADGLSLGTLFAAFGAGLISVLSPCVVPLLPAYLSLVSGVSVEDLQEADDSNALRARIRRGSLGFVAGFSAVLVLLGGFTAGLGYALTAGDIEVTRTILDTSVNGDYVVEPAHLRGEKPLQFIGSTVAAAPPQDDWGSAQNSGF